MTKYEENQQEKAQLYFEYYDEVTELRDAFEREWDDFTDTWGTQLAQTLDGVNTVQNPAAPEEFVVIEPDCDGDDRHQWIFRQGIADWGGILRNGWWKRTGDLSKAYDRPDDNTLAGVSFYHRLRQNRDLAIQDGTLVIEFWQSASNSDEFKRTFNRNFSESADEIERALPTTAGMPSITDASAKLITATYEIHSDSGDDFFQSYIEALARAFTELALQNKELIAAIDQVYDQSIEMYR